jgi:hypothetical protein
MGRVRGELELAPPGFLQRPGGHQPYAKSRKEQGEDEHRASDQLGAPYNRLYMLSFSQALAGHEPTATSPRRYKPEVAAVRDGTVWLARARPRTGRQSEGARG